MKNFNVAWEFQTQADSHEEAALIAAGVLFDPGNTATIVTVEDDNDVRVVVDTEGGKTVIIRDERAYGSVATKAASVQEATVQGLQREIESRIARLREVLQEPVSLRVGEQVSLELRPAGDDDLIGVCHDELGFTNVNYTDEGVVIDVWPAELSDGPVEPVSTQCVFRDQLEGTPA